MSGSAPMPAPQPALDAAVEKSMRALLERVPEGQGRDLVRKAFDVAVAEHGDQRRKNGEPYISHPLQVAHLLCDYRMDPFSIAAGLLHDVLEDTHISYDDLKTLFPEPIPAIVQGVTKIGKISFDATAAGSRVADAPKERKRTEEERRHASVENIRKILLAMARDIRVIIVKLCDRLHNMRTLEHLAQDRREAIARETLEIYAPIANRLGIVRMKVELEDLAMRWLYSEAYKDLARQVDRKKIEREEHIDESITILRNFLAEHGHTNIEIDGRSKHFFSIYRKMITQGLTFDEIYDLHAIRILCNSEAKCYEILGLVHSFWHPVPGRIKDYIGMPKANGYQSLHTTVIGHEGVVTEVQIRSRDMHELAEFGVAAHWKYKEGKLDDVSVDNRMKWLRQLADWAQESGDPDSLLDGLKRDAFSDIVLCFTPRGDVIELPAGATPIDFAFSIHTAVGERCVGARVNRRMVSLRTTLAHGDVVEVQTSPTGHPSRDWLDVAITNRAKSKIKHWLKSKEMNRWVDDGRNAISRVLHERNIEVNKTDLDKALGRLLEPYRLHTIEDLLAEIGFGSISPQAAIARMDPEWTKPRRAVKKKAAKTHQRKQGPIIVDELDDLSKRIANCCSPIPGDPIVAFVTRGRGLTVHHDECPNINRYREDPEEAARIYPARWNTDGPISHTVFLKVDCEDRAGLLLDVTNAISKNGCFIVACHTKSDKKKGLAVLRFEVDITDIREYNAIIANIQAVKGVVTAERTTRPPKVAD